MALKLTIPLPPHFLEFPGDPKMRWSNWINQLKNFFTLTDLTLPKESKLTNRAKNAYLASLLGTEGARILMAHPVATTAESATFDKFSAGVGNLFQRPVNLVRAEFDFRNRRQGPTESVADFLTALRTLYADCDTSSISSDGAVRTKIQDHDLAMQLAIGCHSRRAQEKLLLETSVELNKFVQIMQADESATETSSAMRNEGQYNVAAFRKSPRYATQHRPPDGNKHKPCLGCGKTGHSIKTRECPAFEKHCNHCKKPNHFASQCLAKKKLRSLRLQKFSAIPQECTVNLQLRAGESDLASLNFLVDTGADCSTLPKSVVSKYFPPSEVRATKQQIINYDGTALTLFGCITCDVTHNDQQRSANFYIVPDGMSAVAGRDLISSLGLRIDGASLCVRSATAREINDASTDQASEVLHKFPSLVSPSLGTFPNYVHEIKVTHDFVPHVSKLRSIPLVKRDAVHREVQAMIDAGVWSPIEKSEAAHAMVCVNKKDGGVRITTDFSPLNNFIIPERHPLPLVEDLLLKLRGMRVFSKLDLRKGYYHILLDEDSRQFTATVTPLGLMAYNRLPMGLKDSASAFQKCVSATLDKCMNTICFADDILVYGATYDEHDHALNCALAALADKQFRLNTNKCELRVPEITFLGFRVNNHGIHPNPDKIAPIKNAATPNNIKQVQSFLGAVNYLSEFIPQLAEKAEPLRILTRKNQPFQWKAKQDSAFQELKNSISADFELAIFNPNAKTIVTVDASDVGLGAQLSQIQDCREVPVQFASHTLLDRERNFAVNEREALACLWAIERWEKFLLGNPFTLRTDHSSLLTLLKRPTTARKSAKFTRWSQRLSRFDFTVEHIRGANNCIADALSRLPQPSQDKPAIEDDEPIELYKTIAALSRSPISVTALRQQSSEDPELSIVINYTTSTWPSKRQLSPELLPFYSVRDSLSLEDGCLIRDESRIVVPTSMRNVIIDMAHDGHPGIVRSKRQLRQSYWWPGMDTQIEEKVKYCLACQDSNKAHKPTPVPPTAIPIPSEPWHKLAIDICGPFATAPKNKRFVTVLIDYATGFPEVLLSDDITSHKIISWLTSVFARFGNPSVLVSDNGKQFCSELFEDFLTKRDILHWHSAVYNPRQNGKVEAFNRYIKHGVQTFQADGTEFESGIQQLLFNYRLTSPTPDGKSPAKLMFGRQPRANFEPARRKGNQSTEASRDKSTPGQRDGEEPARLPRYRGPYQANDLVRVRLPHIPKGQTPFSEPRRVTEVLGNYTYRLSDGQVWNARKLVRHRRRPQAIEMDLAPSPRRSRRRTHGLPPVRFSFDTDF